MNLIYKIPSFSYMRDAILAVQSEEQSDFFTECLFRFYPQFEQEKMKRMTPDEKREYLTAILKGIYQENEPLFMQKQEAYQRHWDASRIVVEEAFSEIFAMDLRDEFNDMTGYLSLNPVCPRYLDTHAFDLFYLNSERGAMGLALHEITHFVWFKRWNLLFHDDPAEYEAPHVKWLLSEIVVDAILQETRLNALNPYRDENVYAYFYHCNIGGKPLLSTMLELFAAHPIESFMQESFALVKQYETEIRSAEER